MKQNMNVEKGIIKGINNGGMHPKEGDKNHNGLCVYMKLSNSKFNKRKRMKPCQ